MFVILFQRPLGSPCRNGENEFSDKADFYEPFDSPVNAVPEVSVKNGKSSRSIEKSASKSTTDPAKGAEGAEKKKSKELELKEFYIPELDCIFNDFKTSFDPFVQNRQDLENSEDSFKKAMQSLKDIHPKASIREYIAALSGKMKDEGIQVKLKEGVLTIYKEGAATVRGISDAVSALNAMLKAGKDLKEMPFTIEQGSTDAVDRAEHLDVQGILKREFKSVWDLAKIPKLKKAFSNNVKQIKGAPDMVRDFCRKTKEIILEIYDAFADDEDKKKIEEEIAAERDDSKERNDAKQEGAEKKGKSESGDEKTKKKKKDDLHKSLKFEKVGLADIDNVFTSLASTFNPFVETRERIQTARESFENIVTSMRNFNEKKELKEYLQELKKDAKEGNITIYIDTEDGEIKVKAVKGVKPPKLYRDAVKALNDLHSSVKEAVELEPHVQLGIEECFERINHIDPKRDFHDLLQKKKDVFTLPGKIKKFNDNRKKLQEIPGIVKEFFLYVNRLLKEMLEILTGEKEANTTEEEDSKEDEQEEDISDRSGEKEANTTEEEDSKEDEQEKDISDREAGGEGEDGDREDNGEDSGDQDDFEDSEESDEDEKLET